jgi:hypothetical protein
VRPLRASAPAPSRLSARCARKLSLVRTAVNFLILALVALAITVLPAGDATLRGLITALTLAFLVGIALFGYKLYRENRLSVDAMSVGQRAALYGSVAAALLTFAATGRLFALGIAGQAAWFGLLVLSSLGVFLAYSRTRRHYR